MHDGNTHEIPSWSTIQSAARTARESGDVGLLERIEDAALHVPPQRLSICDMGPSKPISTWVTDVDEDGKENECPFWNNSRYMVSNIQEANTFFDGYIEYTDEKCLFDKDLIIIDSVNDLRLYEFERGSDRDYYDYRWRERMPEPRARMEQIVETLDDFGCKNEVVIIGVFHSNRTTLTPHHPSMGDFKETSKIEYRGVSAIELVRADSMRWSNHPKAPKVPQGTEALGMFVLKGRGGMRTEQNKPIWLAADGAHNLIMPLD